MQPCLSNYTIPRVAQLKKIVLYCRQNARFPVHSSPRRKFQKCTALVLVGPDLNEWLLPCFSNILQSECESLRHYKLIYNNLYVVIRWLGIRSMAIVQNRSPVKVTGIRPMAPVQNGDPLNDLWQYTLLQNKWRRWLGAPPPPPPPTDNFWTVKLLPQQTRYRWKGNLTANRIHFKYRENIWFRDFMSNFREMAPERLFEKISNFENMKILHFKARALEISNM